MKSPWLVACDFNHYTAILTLRLISLMANSCTAEGNKVGAGAGAGAIKIKAGAGVIQTGVLILLHLRQSILNAT